MERHESALSRTVRTVGAVFGIAIGIMIFAANPYHVSEWFRIGLGVVVIVLCVGVLISEYKTWLWGLVRRRPARHPTPQERKAEQEAELEGQIDCVTSQAYRLMVQMSESAVSKQCLDAPHVKELLERKIARVVLDLGWVPVEGGGMAHLAQLTLDPLARDILARRGGCKPLVDESKSSQHRGK
jgi:hypothetical protein